MIKIIVAGIVVCMLSGCAGMMDIKKGIEAFTKDSAMMPDELAISGDFSPKEAEHYDKWHMTEVTGGLKWKLK